MQRKKPFAPTLAIIVGLLVGVAGLAMTVLGIGGVSVTHFSVSNAEDIQTASGGVLAMLVGFGLSGAILLAAFRVDEKRAEHGTEKSDGNSFTGDNIRFG